MTNIEAPLIDGKTIEEWDREWVAVAGDLMIPQPQLWGVLGLVRCSLAGQIMAIASGTDRVQGLKKRFYDLTRPGNSSRNHHMGRMIFEHRHELDIEVLVTGRNSEHAREIAEDLKWPMIRRHEPIWTAPPRDPRTFSRPRKRKAKSLKTQLTPYTGTIPKG